MSLTLRLGDETITRKASNLQIKNIALGGFASVSFNVARKLEQSLFDTFTDCFVYDAATGEQVGGGRLLDQGRNDDGTWSVTCLGEGLASMQDRTTPIFYIDQTLDQWVMSNRTTKRITLNKSTYPGSSFDEDSLVMEAQENVAMASGSELIVTNRICVICDMQLGGLGFRHKSGGNSAVWDIRGRAYSTDMSTFNTPIDDDWSTTLSGRRIATVNGDFTPGRTIAAIQWRNASAVTSTTDSVWSAAREPIVRSQVYLADGTLKTAGYTLEYVTTDEVITDWVVRYCPRLNAQTGLIDKSSTEQIEQMAYLDGIHGMQLADDLIARDKKFTWQVWEQGSDGKWPFYYKPLSTSVQYEASTADGFSAPSPSTEVYNRVTVTGKTGSGRDTSVTRTKAVASLDAVGLIREATIPLGSEIWSTSAANKIGDDFLAEHEFPPNAGTLTIARAIYDAETGRWVKPWNIRAGGLIRVRGIQPTPDTLNATSPDGVTVFRVVSVTYDDDSGAATLELDSYQLTAASAVAYLARGRTRRASAGSNTAKSLTNR